jgi:predicted RNA-binding Zn ribbon-like protein
METPVSPASMRIVGGNLALDFVNTRIGPPHGPADADVLGDYAGVVAWARHLDIVSETAGRRMTGAAKRDPAEAGRVFDRALALRESLDHLFRTVASGGVAPQDSRSALKDEEADLLGRAELVHLDGAYAWSWARDESLARPLGPVVHAAVELITAGPLDRIKACGGCLFLFVDESKNRSRRWCSMDDCGASEKMRRYVARRAARRR